MSKTIGIIGTGAIAEAVVIGLCTQSNPPENILLSPRNKHRAKQLAERFSNVDIGSDNQTVVSKSDVIFLGIRPQIVGEVLQELGHEDLHVLVERAEARAVRGAVWRGAMA